MNFPHIGSGFSIPLFAVDYDGVVADTNAVKRSWIKENLKMDVPLHMCDRTACVPIIGEPAYGRMSNVVYERAASMSANPVSGAESALRRMMEAGPAILLSARTEKRLEYAVQWLERYGLDGYFEDFVSSDGKTKLDIVTGYQCQVLIDDDVRHLLPPKRGVTGVLLKPSLFPRQDLPQGIQTAESWDRAAILALRAVRQNGMA